MKYQAPELWVEEYAVQDVIAVSPVDPTEPGGPPDDPYLDDKF